jgi:hypothetical protein
MSRISGIRPYRISGRAVWYHIRPDTEYQKRPDIRWIPTILYTLSFIQDTKLEFYVHSTVRKSLNLVLLSKMET